MNRAAYFDVDGTLAGTNIVLPLIWLKQRESTLTSKLWLAALLVRGPWWMLLDRFDRDASNRSIYAQYAGLPTSIKALAEPCFNACIRPRLFEQGLAKARELQSDGVEIVLVTGSLDFWMEPLAKLLKAKLVAPGLCESNGFFTGKLAIPPMTGERKAEAVRAHALAQGIALQDSFAFGDALADAEMLGCVGHPSAVSPDPRLARLARERQWPILNWRSA